MNSFIAIYNQSGIACASDTDNTIYRLSKEKPVAIAICPYSPIPWESIISQYLLKGEPEHHKTHSMLINRELLKNSKVRNM